MLSYRHAFHAGNAADVHKHSAWMLGIRALLKKPSAFRLFDAYAGAGAYSLQADAARKTGEWERGIGRIVAATGALPGVLAEYAEAVRSFDTSSRMADAPASSPLQYYPGSPQLAAALLREQDRLVCLELHPADFPALKHHFRGRRNVHVHHRDAREGLPALLPPPEKRGLVLIDPAYEQAVEYAQVPAALLAAIDRWPTGSYLLWYPLLSGNPHLPMLDTLVAARAPIGKLRKLLVHELRLFPDAPGLQGSGLAWINPPWQAEDALADVGEWLCTTVGSPGAAADLGWRITEQG